jgi:hypothetical protein
MSRQTSRGSVPVATLCQTFKLARQAFTVAPARRDGPPPVRGDRMPRRPSYAPREEVLKAIRAVVRIPPHLGTYSDVIRAAVPGDLGAGSEHSDGRRSG